MDSYRARLDDVDLARAWLAAFGAAVALLVAGSLFLRDLVWDGFVWRYFWGPVEADALGETCTVMTDSGPEFFGSQAQCAQLKASDAIYAEPGYTLVSEIGYMVVLIFMLIGVYALARRLEIGEDLRLYFALVPFMLFGGALRVVEDAFDRAAEIGLEPAIGYPLNTLLISPLIYFTVFALTLAALMVAIKLDAQDVVENYRRALAAMGTALLAITFGYLAYLSMTKGYVSAYPQMLIVTVVVATALAYGLYRGIDGRWPEVTAGIGGISFFVLWAHAIDGVANVISADWLKELGVVDATGTPLPYSPKHPANDFVIDVTEAIQPAPLTAAIGTSWPFLALKLGVASAILWLFTEDFVEDSTSYALLLLIAVTAVGLGPGTRDMIRVTFGI